MCASTPGSRMIASSSACAALAGSCGIFAHARMCPIAVRRKRSERAAAVSRGEQAGSTRHARRPHRCHGERRLGARGEPRRRLLDRPSSASHAGARPRACRSRPSHARDIATDDLHEAVAGADAVVHLAWEIQPSRDRGRLWRTNVLGTRRVIDAVIETGVPRLVMASSIGVYSPGPKDRLVDETWPRAGIGASTYSVHKAAAERLLDAAEVRHPRAARDPHAAGADLPASLRDRAAPAVRGAARAGAAPPPGPAAAVPRRSRSALPGGARARRCRGLPARGALADGRRRVQRRRRARPRHADDRGVARRANRATSRARSHAARSARPTRCGCTRASRAGSTSASTRPLVSSERIRDELGWHARRSALETINEVIDGLADGAGAGTAPLAPDTGLLGRLAELGEGVGSRSRGT